MAVILKHHLTPRHSFPILCVASFILLLLLHHLLSRSSILDRALDLHIIFGGNTGDSFRMRRERQYLGPRLPDLLTRHDPSFRSSHPIPHFITCSSTKWAVFTTVFPPSPTIHQFVNLHKHGWCTVVVGDLKTPSNFSAGPGVLYVSPAMQRDLPFATVRATPWNHFGRKNLGYLIAIAGGARVIYDTDDDNVLINGTIVDPLGPSFAGVEKRRSVYHLFNPYSAFGGLPRTWPRGFPLEAVAKRGVGFFGLSHGRTKASEVGVVQLLADVDPDLDAVYRMTSKLPLRFDVLTEKVYVPFNTLAPYNAQSTVVMGRAFWSLLLPISVPGRVSDIWRAYFYQPIMWNSGLGLVFHKPAVNHIRSPHKLAADFQAELDLYSKADPLTRFLASQSLTATSVPEQMEEQVIEMYEHGIVELQDVKLVQAWIQDLVKLNYSFPGLVNRELAAELGPDDGKHIKVHRKMDGIINLKIGMHSTQTHRKNLVVILGHYRIPEVTWRYFEKHVLVPLGADLAAVVSVDAASSYRDEFFLQRANFSFVYNDAEWSYRESLTQIAKVEKLNLSEKVMDKQFETRGNWLGCLENSDGERQKDGTGMCQIVNRYIAYLYLRRQLPHYDSVIFTSSDSLFYCAPNTAPPSQHQPFGRFLKIHNNGGFNDRMYTVNRAGAFAMLRSAVFVLKDENFASKLFQKYRGLHLSHEKILRGVAEAVGMDVEWDGKVCSYWICGFDDDSMRQSCSFENELGCFKHVDEATAIQAQLVTNHTEIFET